MEGGRVLCVGGGTGEGACRRLCEGVALRMCGVLHNGQHLPQHSPPCWLSKRLPGRPVTAISVASPHVHACMGPQRHARSSVLSFNPMAQLSPVGHTAMKAYSARQPGQPHTHLGNSTLCTRPNIWRGMFLNMVRPTKKVLKMLEPNHRPYAPMWTKAAAFDGAHADELAATATTAKGASVRTCAHPAGLDPVARRTP